MFHTRVLAASGTVVDFDRASFLMDKDLLQASIDAMRDEQQNAPRWDANYGAQWVWDVRARRHSRLGLSVAAASGADSSPASEARISRLFHFAGSNAASFDRIPSPVSFRTSRPASIASNPARTKVPTGSRLPRSMSWCT
jgi:hypothetical protein